MAFIAVTDLAGNITYRKAESLTPILDAMAESRKVAGLLLRINSPGGEATASEILYRKLLKVREKKPVIVSVSSVCASGAYWIASGSTKIFAMQTSIVGSIGVIGVYPSFKKLLDRMGVEVNVTKVGKYKDLNNPFVELTEEGREKTEKIMNSIFYTFRDAVALERKIEKPKIDDIATGEVFSSQDALSSGLIDAIGTFDDALENLKAKVGVKKVRSVQPKRPFLPRIIGTTVIDSISEFMDSGKF
ncbi:MAG: signal peptide peptidase SppA [Thermoplasmataceae archaeon]